MAIHTEGRYRAVGAVTWLTLFAAQAGTTYAWATAALPEGSYEWAIRHVDTTDSAASAWTATRTLTVSHAPASPVGATTVLVAEVEYRAGTAGTWVPLTAAPVAEQRFAWDTSGLPNGTYQARTRLRYYGSTDPTDIGAWSDPRTVTVSHASAAAPVTVTTLPAMRGMTATERQTQASETPAIHCQVLIQDEDGQWRDMAALMGEDFFIGADWQTDVDQPVWSATFQFHRELRALDGTVLSLSPLMEGSPINERNDGSYAPLIQAGRRVKILTATLPMGTALTEGAKKLVFDGLLDPPEFGGPVLTVPARDLGARLQDSIVRTARTYGSDTGTPLATVESQILADNGHADVVLAVANPAPNWHLRKFEQEAGPTVLDALIQKSMQIGHTIRYRWTGPTTSQLVLSEPVREKTVPDATFGPGEYIDLPSFTFERDEVRNVIRGVITTADGTQIVREVRDDDSINALGGPGKGERFMQLAYDTTSNIDTEAELLAVLNNALSDLSQPFATAKKVGLYLWSAELGDLYELASNAVHHDTPQRLAVVGIRHTIRREGDETIQRTELTMRGRPAGAYRRWLEGEAVQVTAIPVETRITIQEAASDSASVALQVTARAYRNGQDTGAVPNVRLTKVGGLTQIDGPSPGVAAPSGTLWRFARPATGTGEVGFGAVLAGAMADTDYYTITNAAEIGVPRLSCYSKLVARGAIENTVDVTAEDPEHPGATVTLTLDNYEGISPAPTPLTVTGPSPLTHRYVFPRPAAGTGQAEVLARASASGRVTDREGIVVTERANALAFTDVVLKIVGDAQTTLTLQADAVADEGGAPAVYLESLSGTTLVSGPAVGVRSPSGTQWVFAKPAEGQAPGTVSVRSELAGYVGDRDSQTVYPQGEAAAPSIYALNLKVTPLSSTDTAIVVRVSPTDPVPQGPNSITLTFTQVKTGGVTPPGPQTVSSGGFIDYTITRGAFKGGTGMVTFEANAPDRVIDTNAVDVPAQERDTASLLVTAQTLTTTPTQMVVRVTSHNPLGAGMSLTVAAVGCTVSPTAEQFPASGAERDYTITRPAFQAGSGRVVWTLSAPGMVSAVDSVDVPAQERDTLTLSVRVDRVGAIGSTQVVYRVWALSPAAVAAAPPLCSITPAAVGCTVSPATAQAVTARTDFAGTNYVDFTVTAGAYGGSPGRVSWTIAAPGFTTATDGADVPARARPGGTFSGAIIIRETDTSGRVNFALMDYPAGCTVNLSWEAEGNGNTASGSIDNVVSGQVIPWGTNLGATPRYRATFHVVYEGTTLFTRNIPMGPMAF